MKIILYDYSNRGVLYMSQSLIVINMLKRGLVDTDMHTLFPNHPGYEKISKERSITDNLHFQLTRNNDIINLSEGGINPFYLKRRQLVKLRANLMEKLINYAWQASGKLRIGPWDGVENNLEALIDKSNPDTGEWANSLLEYAHIHSIDPLHAYKEIKLEVENLNSLKIRLYASMTFYVGKINNITEQAQIDGVLNEILDRFWRDTWI